MENKKLDLQEVEMLLKQTTRPKIQLILQNFMDKVKQDISLLEKQQQDEKNKQSNQEVKYIGINRYSWDQEGSKITLYINMKDIGKIGQDNIDFNTSEDSLDLKINQYQGKNYRLHIKKLGGSIINDKSKFKLKQNYVVLTLVKKQNNPWGNIYFEKKNQPTKDMKKNQDPNAGLMDMMKKMYDEGDDKMKRTIAEAWTKAHDKKSNQKQ